MSFNQTETGGFGIASRLHQWVTELEQRLVKHVDEDNEDQYILFSYNGTQFQLTGYGEETYFTFTLSKANGEKWPRASVTVNSDGKIILDGVAREIIKIVRREIFCEVCDGICENRYQDLLGDHHGGLCNICSKYFNERGCRVCANPFGKLVDGMHQKCAKRRRINE